MSSKKLTQAEADRLLNMLKKTLKEEINFPSKRETVEFNVAGDSKRDIFTVSIFRGNINRLKYNFGARITRNNIMLLELHINPSNVHINPPNNEKIEGSHWHVYTEEYGRSQAFPAEDIEAENFVKNTIMFLERFNVVEKPNVNAQLEIV